MSSEDNLTKACPKCGARFLGGRLYWSTGKPGDPRDLAGLVCQNWEDATCINPMRDDKTGDTWKKRFEFMNALASELDLPPIE